MNKREDNERAWKIVADFKKLNKKGISAHKVLQFLYKNNIKSTIKQHPK